MGLGSPFNTLNNVRHSAGTIRTENLNRIDGGLLSDTILLSANSTRAMSSVTIAILINVAGRDSLSPVSAALKVNMFNVSAGVDDVDINTLTTVGLMNVFAETCKVERLLVGDTGKTPGGALLGTGGITLKRVNSGVFLNIGNLSREITLAEFEISRDLSGSIACTRFRVGA